jgi:hypothetical protein
VIARLAQRPCRPAIATRHGRAVKGTGDGSIIEFSVIDPRIEVQNGMVELDFGLLRPCVPAAKGREARSGDLHVAVMTA